MVQMSMFQPIPWKLYSTDPCWRGKIMFFMWFTESCSFSQNRTAWNFVCSKCHWKDQGKNEIGPAFISLEIFQFCNKHWQKKVRINIELEHFTMSTYLTKIFTLPQEYQKKKENRYALSSKKCNWGLIKKKKK